MKLGSKEMYGQSRFWNTGKNYGKIQDYEQVPKWEPRPKQKRESQSRSNSKPKYGENTCRSQDISPKPAQKTEAVPARTFFHYKSWDWVDPEIKAENYV